MRKGPLITAVINAHREGMQAKPSLESFIRSAERAKQTGLDVELLAILDRPDEITKEIFRACGDPKIRIVETDFGDLGSARNYAAKSSKGKYVAFLDADDLWGCDWLACAAAVAQTRDDPVIWHPEISIYFGASEHIFTHVDMESEAFDPVGLLVTNYWTALSFAAREIYLRCPYQSTDLKGGFGFEDWCWNMQTISDGILHKVVPETGHAIRRKENSLSRETINARAVPRPTKYLAYYLRSRTN